MATYLRNFHIAKSVYSIWSLSNLRRIWMLDFEFGQFSSDDGHRHIFRAYKWIQHNFNRIIFENTTSYNKIHEHIS